MKPARTSYGMVPRGSVTRSGYFLALAIISYCHSQLAQQPRHESTLRIEVRDKEGAIVAGAHILLRADKSGGFGKTNEDQIALTGKNGGQTLFVNLGFYDLCVMSDAFTPQCRKLIVENDRLPTQEFHLIADPGIAGRIGDTFPEFRKKP